MLNTSVVFYKVIINIFKTRGIILVYQLKCPTVLYKLEGLATPGLHFYLAPPAEAKQWLPF